MVDHMNTVFETAQWTEGWTAICEDRAEIIETADAAIIVVADGCGGTAGGGDAAEAVIEAVRSAVSRQLDIRRPETWCRTLTELDHELSVRSAGQTTAVVTVMTAETVLGASVGDSGAWLIRADGHTQLTECQRRKPLLGDGGLPVPFAARHGGATLLVATDGLLKYATPSVVCRIALGLSLQDSVRALADSVRLRSGGLQDDIGVALCRPPV